MQVDIGRVFSNTWAMLRERFLGLLGLWGVFFGLQIVGYMVIAAVFGMSAFATGMLDDPTAGFSFGMIATFVLFYVLYLYLAFAQQSAMSVMASPLERPAFGDALTGGFRGGLSLVGAMLLLLVAYFAFVLIAGLIGAVLSFLGETAALLVAIIFIPVVIYLACRLCLLVPVVAVDRVLNPIKAIGRTWSLTEGNVLRILAVIFVFALLAIILFGGMAGLFSVFGEEALVDASAADSIGLALFVMIAFLVIFALFSMVSAAAIASLHAEVSDAKAEDFGQTFE